jgi:hypothetical protein
VGSCTSWAARVALLAGLLLLTAASAAVGAVPGFDSSLERASDSGIKPVEAPDKSSHHGPTAGHLPAVQQELDVVGKLEPTGRFGDVVPGQIADLSVHKGFAYLNSWTEPSCSRGGTYVADIRDPSNPKEVGFLPATVPFYHGEGAHVVTLNTPQFQGDLLAVNNETCQGNSQGVPTTAGGFDLWDVSNPAAPVPLIQNAGDRSPVSSLAQDPTEVHANSYHSVFVWQDGPRAFLVGVDNIEVSDVDIYDITNPRQPEFIADFNPRTGMPQIVDFPSGIGTFPSNNHHDMVVKEINGQMRMLVSYWDAGYVQMNVDDPSNPAHITDTAFDEPDPLTGFDPPEGNAHQAEYSFDNQFFLAADEDFSAYRAIEEIGGQPADPPFGIGVPVNSAGDPIPELQIEPGDPLEGDTRFIGDACDPATIPAPAGNTVAVAERGGVAPGGAACGFELKAQNAEGAGYDNLVIFNNHSPATGNRCEVLLNMIFSEPPTVSIKTIFVGRQTGFRILGVFDPSTYKCVEGDPTNTPAPAVGTDGETLRLALLFDGWGYAHLYDASTSEELDAFAIPEALDERYAFDFGDLSIHEFATDPTEHLVYSSYYSGGIRVFRYSRANGIEQVGAWIDSEGSNFWGIEQFTTPQGERLLAGSDRDFGLVILRYTGAGAPQPPACSDVTVMVPFKQSANVPLTCSDPNGNPLRESTTTTPSGGTLSGNPDSGSVTFTHTGNRLGPAGSFGFKANDGAADSNTATASLVAVARNGGRCFNPFVGTREKDIIVGSRFGDRIRGVGGADTLRARRGADCLSGGRGVDRLLGERGNDRLLGNAAADRLFGGPGRDRMIGGGGNDGLGGRGGNDRLSGGKGPDRLNGGDGNDRLNAGGGTNRLNGGGGNDRLNAQNGKQDKVRCGAGQDRATVDPDDTVAGDCEVVL